MGAGDEQTGCGGFCSFIIIELTLAGARTSLAKVVGSKFGHNAIIWRRLAIVYQKPTKLPDFQNNFMLT